MRALLLVSLLLAGLAGCQPPPKQNYFVFFEKWSAELDGQSRALIRAAVAYAKAHPDDRIAVIGYADPTGSKEANVDISATRADRVRDALVADGIASARITTQGRGEVQPTWTEQEARRVEIRVGLENPVSTLRL
ncbi:MAG: OmpA family protein [Acetobacteraceae bacterium]|nr:OmpA family protein [Acetobacteraceae bacterium]